MWSVLVHGLALNIASYTLLSWLMALLVMSALFLVSRRQKRYDYVDVGWGGSFAVIALTAYTLSNLYIGSSSVKLLVLSIVLIWAARLSLHILMRLRRSSEEDRRYVELRSRWPSQSSWQIYLRIFVVQSLLAMLVSIPVIHLLLLEKSSWTSWTTLGLIVWIFGFSFEVIADYQLKSFLAQKSAKGKLMTTGLWSVSRHPNYFGEIVLWWGITLMCIGTPHGWVGMGGASVITYLICFVSGVPLAEKSSSAKPGWRKYASKTSLFIPFWPVR